jgi:hypothetical protein
MSILIPALAVAFAAFCVWLGVRVYNRRERWAKWTAVGLTSILIPLTVYAVAYVRLVDAVPIMAGFHVPPHEIVPDYTGGDLLGRGDRDQKYWEPVFAPANWIDRRIRHKMWSVETAVRSDD